MRQCVFCGRTPVNREHVFPNWLSELYGKLPGYSNTTHEGVIQREWPQVLFQQKVKVVCESCNGGWMSTLEASVLDYLGPMIKDGKSFHLDQKKQSDIAFWVVKTILMSEFVSSSDRKIPDSEYLRLYRERRAPDNCAIFISYRQEAPVKEGFLIASTHTENIHTVRAHEDLADGIRKSIKNGGAIYGSALIVGHVAFHMILSTVDAKSPLTIESLMDTPDGDKGLPTNMFSLPIHPYDHNFHWPATAPIELCGGVEGFVRAFNK